MNLRQDAGVSVLLIEDNDIDAEIVQRIFQQNNVGHPLVVANDAEIGLEILRRTEPSESLPRPYLILLDLNLPRMNGHEFLSELREDPVLSQSIVFVLTSSDLDEDISAAYEKCVAGYMCKTSLNDDALKLTEIVNRYAKMVEFPPSLMH